MSDDGVYWADKNRSMDEKTGTNDTASEFLPYLVENGVPIYVCPPCVEARQLGEENFYSNLTLAGVPKLIELAAEGSVISF